MYAYINNSSKIEINIMDSMSLEWLVLQRPLYYLWVFMMGFNCLISYFLLKYLPKWHIYQNDSLFFMRNLLVSSICFQISIACVGLFHLFNGYARISESSISPKLCHFTAGITMVTSRIFCWNVFWISVDRFFAVLWTESRCE